MRDGVYGDIFGAMMTEAPLRRRFGAVMPRPEPAITLWVRRACIVVFGIHMVFATWSFYRRIYQVLRVDLHTSGTVLGPGTTIAYDVITSGEVQNRIRLELIQGEHAVVLREERARVASISAYDPRLFRYLRSTTVTPELLSRFAPGPATLRLTGFGGQKLLRTPPPRVRELAVQIQGK
jgi:hypothetical protein